MDSTLRDLVARHLQAENRHDLPATLATLHPECVFEDLALGWTFTGLAGAARYYTLWWEAFDLTVRGERRHWSHVDTLVAETRFTGLHRGAFCGLPSTGNVLDLRMVVVVDFRDGLMSGERFYYDSRSLFRQLGALAVQGSSSGGVAACEWPSLAQPV